MQVSAIVPVVIETAPLILSSSISCHKLGLHGPHYLITAVQKPVSQTLYVNT